MNFVALSKFALASCILFSSATTLAEQPSQQICVAGICFDPSEWPDTNNDPSDHDTPSNDNHDTPSSDPVDDQDTDTNHDTHHNSHHNR